MELDQNLLKEQKSGTSVRQSKAVIATLLLATLAISAWTAQQWIERVSSTKSFQRDPLWSLKTPTAAAPTAFLRIEGTSFWNGRLSGLVTSPTFLATTTHAARLHSMSDNESRINVAPDSQVWLDKNFIRLQKGLVEVHGKVKVDSGSDRTSSKAMIAFVEGTSTGSEQVLMLEAMQPPLGFVHELNQSKYVSLSWTATGVTKIEFARDSLFQTVLFSVPVETQNSAGGSAQVDFSDRALGAWFVRLRSSDTTLAATAFSLVESQTPDNVRTLGRRWLAWRDRGEAVFYRVEFSKNENFEKIDQVFQVQNREMDLTLVTPGAQFVRVTAVDMTETEFPTRPVAINVADKVEILRASTELTDPDLKLLARGWKIVLNDDEVTRLREGYVILRESELRGIRIADTAKASLGQLVFEISRDESFANPERVKPDSRGELLPPALPLGIIYARLRRIENDGGLGAAGPASRLTTLLPAPKTLPAKTIPGGIDARWSFKLEASSFELRHSADKDFSPENTTVIRTENFSKSIAAEPGSTIFWSVTALDRFGKPISAASNTQIKKILALTPARILSFDVSSKNKVSRRPAMVEPLVPQLQFPAEDAVIVGGARSVTYAKLTWEFKRQKPGERFEIQIATDGDFVNVIEKRKLGGRVFTLRGDLPEGALFWRVRSESSRQWSEARRFELVYE